MRVGKNNFSFSFYSFSTFFIIAIVAFVTYFIIANQLNRSYVRQQVSFVGEALKLNLTNTIAKELELINILGHSRIVHDFFLSPDDPMLKEISLDNFDKFQRYCTDGVVFWINNKDRMLQDSFNPPRYIDASLPENQWYNTLLYETEDFYFNIVYDEVLDIVNLWINIPVFSTSIDGNPTVIGIIGTVLKLNPLVDQMNALIRELCRNSTVFVFNQNHDITFAMSVELVKDKVNLIEYLGAAGVAGASFADNNLDGTGNHFNVGRNKYLVSTIPALKDWYILVSHPMPNFLAMYVAMNYFFFCMMFLILSLFVIMNIFNNKSNINISKQNTKLVEMNKKLSMAVKATKIGLWDMEIVNYDDITNPNNCFNWSDEFRHMLGYSDVNDFPNIFGSWIRLLHPDDKLNTLEHVKNHLQDVTDDVPYDIEYRLMKKNGEYGYFRAYGGTYRDSEGKPLHFVGSLIDVTEDKKILIDLERQKTIAETATQAKSKFLATMSHEIRTPMNAIIGISQMQLQKVDLPADCETAFEKVYNSGNGLLGIINDILDLSKIETGKMEINDLEYDMPSLIHDTIQLNIVRVGTKPIELIPDIDANLPMRIIGDELRIKQVLNNLLSNAIKYTEKGYVKLSIKHFFKNDDIYLHFIVEDTGQGMKPEDCEKLFSEYSRFNIENNKEIEGTGIGLNITKSLVDLMHGTIKAESTYGKGSIFTFQIKQQAVECEPIGNELAGQFANFTYSRKKILSNYDVFQHPMPYGKVLIVDDVKTNLYVAEGLMTPYGMKIDTAISGYMAIEKIKQGELYDIIFMDHMMPLLDGIETTRILRKMGYSNTIVALTANALAGNEEIFKQNGFDDFISKPIDLRKLNNILNKYIRDKHPEAAKKYENKTLKSESKCSTEKIDSKLLQVFQDDAQKAVITLRDTLKCGDIKLFTITVHGMKSILQNIGEFEMSKSAVALELAGINNELEFINKNAVSFINSLEQLTNKITESLSENKDNSIQDIELEQIKEHLLSIMKACEDYNDTDAFIVFDKLNEMEFNETTTCFINKIKDMLYLRSDFDSVVKTIQELMR